MVGMLGVMLLGLVVVLYHCFEESQRDACIGESASIGNGCLC